MDHKNRRSIRKFKQTPISSWEMDQILEAARLAPCSMNAQEMRFVPVTRNTDFIFRNVKFAGYLDGYRIQDDEKPVAYIVIGSTIDCPFDVGIAAYAIVCEAFEHGIGSCIMGSVDRDKVKMSDGYNTQLVVALGHPKDTPKITEHRGSNKYYIANETFYVPKKSKFDICPPEEKGLVMKSKFVIDIDGTICTQKRDYNMAQPIEDNIKKIQKLFEDGNEIQYFTARGTETGIDWKEVTINQLKEWGLPNPENVLFGKPSADVYIDDRALNAMKEKWQ